METNQARTAAEQQAAADDYLELRGCQSAAWPPAAVIEEREASWLRGGCVPTGYGMGGER